MTYPRTYQAFKFKIKYSFPSDFFKPDTYSIKWIGRQIRCENYHIYLHHPISRLAVRGAELLRKLSYLFIAIELSLLHARLPQPSLHSCKNAQADALNNVTL
jgi:hypothetical protein